MTKSEKKIIVRDSKNEIKAEVCNIEQSLCEIEFSQSEYENGIYMRGTFVKVKGVSLEGCHSYGKKVLKEWKPRKNKSISSSGKTDYIG